LLCRGHHLTKTFWTTWHDVQQPDGTVIWTSPSGRTYTTTPGGALFFPQLGAPTEAITPTSHRPNVVGRTLRMPTRPRSRAAERAARITWERSLNQTRIDADLRTRIDADPPPF
ncbi:MAG: HNH endonuclease, partial [Mycobacterium sp.]